MELDLTTLLTDGDKERIRLGMLARAGVPLSVPEVSTLFNVARQTVNAWENKKKIRRIITTGQGLYVFHELKDKPTKP